MLPKKLLFILSILILIIIVLFGLFLFLGSRRKEPIIPDQIEKKEEPVLKIKAEPKKAIPQSQKTEIKEFDDSFFHSDQSLSKPSSEEAEKSYLILMARNFIEDYGSFSLNSGYQHIQALYDKMTREMQNFTSSFISSDPARVKSPVFYSIQTQVVDVSIVEFESRSAVLLLYISRIETDAPDYYNRYFIQQVEVRTVRIGGDWKVAGVYWK